MSYERFRDWLEEALDDLEVARELFQFGRWSKVCFLSHLAVEKALKGQGGVIDTTYHQGTPAPSNQDTLLCIMIGSQLKELLTLQTRS